jgi:hypothetical protein
LQGCQTVTARNTQKELANRKIHKRDYKTLPKNPDFPETTKMILKGTQTSKKGDNNSENKIFLLQISSRDTRLQITRPNEIETTTNKVATRSTERTWL